MRFGVLYDRLARPGDYASLVAQVEAADQLGIDSVWLAAGRSPNPCGALAVVLAALARRTRVVRLGAFRVLGLDHPVRIAEDFAMVDLFAGGRLNFGVAPADEVAEALPRFSEALEVVLTAWTADPFSFAGQYYRFPAQASGGDGVRRLAQLGAGHHGAGPAFGGGGG